MQRTMSTLIICACIEIAHAQSGQGYFNKNLISQDLPQQQYMSIWNRDDLQCQGEARSQASQLVPRPPTCDLSMNPWTQLQCQEQQNHSNQNFKRIANDMYAGCLASRGWAYGVAPPPPVASKPSPAPEPERPIAKPKSSTPTLASTGTGFFVSADGHLLTNAHVVEACERLTAKLLTGSEFQINLVNVDTDNDLALLKSTSKGSIASFRRGPAPLGERVVVFGFPLTGTLTESGNLTTGAVSGLGGIGGDPSKYQISAPVQPGNSGGAVLDETGLVIGVVQSKLNAAKAFKATGDVPQNVNFAIKASVAQNFLEAQGVKYLDKPRGGTKKESVIAEDAVKFTVVIGCYKS